MDVIRQTNNNKITNKKITISHISFKNQNSKLNENKMLM